MKTKKQISCAVLAQLISAFVFAIRIVQSLYYLNSKFQASSHLLWLHSSACDGPGRKPRGPISSQRGSYESNSQGLLQCQNVKWDISATDVSATKIWPGHFRQRKCQRWTQNHRTTCSCVLIIMDGLMFAPVPRCMCVCAFMLACCVMPY